MEKKQQKIENCNTIAAKFCEKRGRGREREREDDDPDAARIQRRGIIIIVNIIIIIIIIVISIINIIIPISSLCEEIRRNAGKLQEHEMLTITDAFAERDLSAAPGRCWCCCESGATIITLGAPGVRDPRDAGETH